VSGQIGIDARTVDRKTRICTKGAASVWSRSGTTTKPVAKRLVDRLTRWMETALNLLKPNDLARRLAVSRAWVYEAAKSGRIPSVRIGGADGPLRFVPEDIERWLTEARAGWLPGGGEGGERSPGTSAPASRTPSSGQRPGRPRRSGQEPLF
jgi:excisionase family DNA binding protein